MTTESKEQNQIRPARAEIRHPAFSPPSSLGSPSDPGFRGDRGRSRLTALPPRLFSPQHSPLSCLFCHLKPVRMSCPAVGSVCGGGPSHPPPLAGAPVTPSCPHSIRGKTKVPCWPGGDTRRVSDARSCSVPHLHIPPWATRRPRAGVPSGSPLPTSTPRCRRRGDIQKYQLPQTGLLPFLSLGLICLSSGSDGSGACWSSDLGRGPPPAHSEDRRSREGGGGLSAEAVREGSPATLWPERIANPLLVTFSELGFLGCGYPRSETPSLSVPEIIMQAQPSGGLYVKTDLILLLLL